MPRLLIHVDDADHACGQLEPWLAAHAGHLVECIVVLSAPRITHRIGKWLAHASREQWRQRWGDRQRERLEPCLLRHAPGCRVEWIQARQPLGEIVEAVRTRHGTELTVLDVRRRKPPTDADGAAAAPAGGPGPQAMLALSGSVSLMLALAD